MRLISFDLLCSVVYTAFNFSCTHSGPGSLNLRSQFSSGSYITRFTYHKIRTRLFRMNPFICTRSSEKSGFRYAVSFVFLCNYSYCIPTFFSFRCCSSAFAQDTTALRGRTSAGVAEKHSCVAWSELYIGEQIAQHKHFF